MSSLEEQLLREELPEYVQRQRELKSVVLLYMRDTLYSQHFEYTEVIIVMWHLVITP